MSKILTLICFIVCALGPMYSQAPDVNGIIYVKSGGTGDGSSWLDATGNLQAAIGAEDVSEVWVAAGTYKPTVTNDRTISFVMKNGVAIYGGFPVTGTPGMGDRDWNTYETILSGDIDNNDTDSTITGDNSYHVIFNDQNGLDHSAILDGFTVTGGNANGSDPHNIGGGMYNNESSPILTNVTITGNKADDFGGGMSNYFFSSPTLTNVTISGNTANNFGGGMFNYYSSSPTLTNVTISGNTANNFGGGMCNATSSSPTLTNVTITGNKADNGGGMYNNFSSPTLTNVTISGNKAEAGGGMFSEFSSSPNVYNSIIFGNGNDNIFNFDGSTPKFYHSLVWGSRETGNWNPDYGTDGGGNIDEDPLFSNPDNGDFTLLDSSLAINAGNNDYIHQNVDLAGNPRIRDNTVDMGAYEYQSGNTIAVVAPDANNIVYVRKGSNGDGSSWSNALGEVADALQWARSQHDSDNTWLEGDSLQIYVAEGTYMPLYHAGEMQYHSDGGRDNAFVMVPRVQLYGGFPANGTPGMEDRDWNAYETILSGDIDNNDTDSMIMGDNSYHVIFNDDNGLDHSAILDGFTVTEGNANGSYPHRFGGGMLNINSSPTLINVTFTGNTADGGGGMYNNSSSPTLTNVTITGNMAGDYGGGMYNFISSSPTLTNVLISGNTAGDTGGGIYNDFYSSPMLTHVTITGNMAGDYGGGMYNYASSPTLTNVTITGNKANFHGGGMYNDVSSPTLTNVVISGNTAGDTGGGIYNSSGNGIFTNTTMAGNSPNAIFAYGFTYWYNTIVWGGVEGTNYSARNSLIEGSNNTEFGNIDATGLSTADVFMDPDNGDYTLQACSPAINAGVDTHFVNLDETTLDLAGQPRVYNSGVIDMGAYEFQGGVDYSNVMFTDTTVEYTGAAHVIEATGIPPEVSVRYTILNADMDTILQAVDTGVYTVIATFFGCGPEVDRTALLTIELPTVRIAPNCAHFSPSVGAEGTAVVSAADFVSNASGGVYPLEVTVYNQWGSRLPGWPQVFNLPSDTYTWDVCSYLGQNLKFSVSNPLGTCHQGEIQLNGSPGAILTSAMQPDALNPAIDTGLLYVYAGNIPAPEDYIPTVSVPCSGGIATRSGQLTPRAQPDWIMPIPCSEESDTAKVIFRTWEVYDKEGRLSTLTDTIVVFRLPRLTPGAFIGEAEVVYECDLIAEVRSDEPVKRFDSWKQPVGLHDYERPHTGLRGVAYEIPATIILDGLTDAFLQGIHVFLEYLECEILRKAGGDVVTIGDIISGDYMSTLLGGSTPEQKRYGFLQALIELNENPLVFLAELEYEFYPYLLLEEGDWILSEGGNFEKVTAEWFYNGNGNSPYWFTGGWPRIYGSGECVSFCDGVDVDDPGCIDIRVPRLSIEAGGIGGDCDTICLPEGVHAGITVKKEELTAWAGSCPQTRGVDTWITQTCWAETTNPCIPQITPAALGDELVVEYTETDKAIKIHLSQWQTIEDNLGPIFDFCYPYLTTYEEFRRTLEALADSEEISSVEEALFELFDDGSDFIPENINASINEAVREGRFHFIPDFWELFYPTTYQVGTHDCAAEVFVPDVQVIDNCSGIHSVKAMVGDRVVDLEPNGVEYRMMENGDTCFVYTYSHLSNPIRITPDHYRGGYDGDLTEVRYEAADNCWNKSEWYKYIKVVDYTPPTVVTNRHLNVTLQDKYAWVTAESMDEGSWDNCSIDLMLGRRSDWINCVTICKNISEPYQTWEAILSDLGLQPGEVGPDFAFLRTLMSDDEVEDYFYDQIVWLWEDGYNCGQKVVHAWLYALAAYIGGNCSKADEHGHALGLQDLEILVDGWFDEPGYANELALLGGGWAREVPVKCEDACQSVTGELLAVDDWCNWGIQWTDINVEDNSTARLVRRLPDLEISCEAYNIFYKDIVEAAAALADGGSGTDTTGLFAALDSAFGYYLATWVDNSGRPTSAYGTPLPESLLSFDYRNVSCAEESVLEEVAVYDHDSAVSWETVVTKTTVLDTTTHTESYGIIGINCAGAITQDVWVDLDECGQGIITRRFFVSSGCGEHAPKWEVQQVIEVQSACGMRESMFDLPANVGTRNAPICLPRGLSNSYLPENIGAMTVQDHLLGKLCNSFAIGSVIQPHDVVGVEGMVKYTIDWTAIDWCADRTSTNREFTYTQEVIAVIDPACDAITQTVGTGINDANGIVTRQVDRKDFILHQNYPNPYDGYTVIGFELPERTEARLTIYDVTGKALKVIEGEYERGYNEVQFTGSDLDATGVLYYQLDTERFTATRKMVRVD